MNNINAKRWFGATIAGAALTCATLCSAQSLITLSNDSSQSPAFYNAGPAGVTYTWNATGGPNGGGCIQEVIDGTTTTEFDPAFNVSFNTAPYYQVTFQMKVDSASGTTGAGGSGGYGHLQCSFRNSSYSWNGVGYTAIYPPAANGWVTYTYAVPNVAGGVAHLQFQLQGGTYSGPVTNYIGNVTVVPIPNPAVQSAFTSSSSVNWQNYGMSGTWDSSKDAPYYNPVTGAGPTSITPAGSVQFDASTPKNYQGGQLNMGFNPSQFQSVAFDLYYDGPTPSTSTDFGGFQILIANGSSPYNWVFIGNANFNAGMVGKWTHFNLPCAASGIVNAAGFAIQSIPGSGSGTTPITFHIDNIQTWNPVTRPIINGLTVATPGGIKMNLDANGNSNIYDQEGISTPSTNNSATDVFWVNQTPATYSFTLTNFPSPAAAPGLDAHIYLCNGDSLTAFNNGYGYNQTYSGANYNLVDYLGLHVRNGNSGGVVAMVDWKTNAPNANAFSNIFFTFPTMTSANGTWAMNFTDNTHGNVVAADGSVNSFTLPDFVNDPNYSANFTPATSMVHFGVAKNGNVANNTKGFTLSSVLVTNNVGGVLFNDSFGGPGLKANYNWQVCQYYQFAAIRAVWQPAGTAYWIQWNTTASGWGVQSSSNLLGNWGDAGVVNTYVDSTGTNTLGAIPAASLPAGNAGLFRMAK